MVGKSKSGFEDFCQIRWIWIGFDLNVFHMEDLDFSFLKEMDLDLNISKPQIHLFQNWMWI